MADVRGTCAIPILAWSSLACLRRVPGTSFRRPLGTEALYRRPSPACRTAGHTAAAAIQNARLYSTAEIYGSELEKRLSDMQNAERALDQAEECRRVSEEKFQKIFDSSPVAFSITTLEEGRFLEVNAAFEARYGYSRQEVLGRTVNELMIWDDPADRRLLVAQLQRGGPIRNVMTRLRAKSGEIKLTVYSADRIEFDGQRCILAVSEDVVIHDPRSTN